MLPCGAQTLFLRLSGEKSRLQLGIRKSRDHTASSHSSEAKPGKTSKPRRKYSCAGCDTYKFLCTSSTRFGRMAASSSDQEQLDLSSLRPADIVAPYFRYDKDNKVSKCLIPGCAAIMTGRHTSNLEKHIHRNHPSESAIIKAKRNLMKKRRSRVGSDSTTETSNDEDDTRMEAVPPRKRRKVCVVDIDADTILDACIDLVTVDGRPLSIFEDRGFQKLFGPLIRNVPNLSINRHTIQRHIAAEAEALRTQIKREVEGRLVSLKLDTATRLHRSVLGVNIQFQKEGKIILRNLAVRELVERHTAENLKQEVLLILNSFGIGCNNIYSVTTDNAANMVKTIRLLDQDVSELETEMSVDVSSSEEEVEMEVIEEGSTDYTIRHLEEDEDGMIFLRTYMRGQNIYTQRCAAHTLQLAVHDALRHGDVDELLDKVRSICRQLRAPTISSILQRLGKSKPILDVPTRWHSTLDMVESLLKFQETCKDLQNISARCLERGVLSLSDHEYRQLLLIKDALTPAKVATKRLQREQLNVGEFVKLWMRCKLQTQEVPSSFAQILVAALDAREKQIMETPAVTCGLYMDPRCHVLLSSEERVIAIQHLESTWHRIQAIKAARFGPLLDANDPIPRSDSYRQMPPPVVPNVAGPSTSMPSEPEDPVEAIIRRKRAEMYTEMQTPARRSIKKILEGITNKILSEPESQSGNDSPLAYWESKKSSCPELYEIASVVLAVPMTQVSVERVFSNLRFILNYLRSRLNPRATEDILFVRCNRCFMHK